MPSPLRTTIISAILAAAALSVSAQAPTPETIIAKRKTLRSFSNTERPGATRQLALDIRTLPAGRPKVDLAYSLASLATEGDAGFATLTDVTLTLAESLAEAPVAGSPQHPDAIPGPYREVAALIRYEHVSIDPKYLTDPLFAKAGAELSHEDDEISHADFTLNDLAGHPVTLSALRGKVVLVNFWATWCPPCRKEMPALDTLNARFGPQGFVVLSISDETMDKVAPFIAKSGYRPTVLLDPGRKVNDLFHVQGIPKSFLFDRDGKLVAQTIDERTEHQFLAMLQLAGLK